MDELIYREEVFQIIGAAIEVHKVLGSGFLEAVYQEALEHEPSLRNLPFVALVCFDSIVVELKALRKLSGHESSSHQLS